MELVGVKINCVGKTHYFLSNNMKIKKNLTVVVKTEKGLYFGKVVSIKESDSLNINDKIIRISTKKDYLNFLKNKKLSNEVKTKCKYLIESSEIKMNIIDCFFTLDRNQLIIKFNADGRIDFRQLAKELGTIYKTRIELRQIGIRDKAKEIGGIGPCGRILCCNSFLESFDIITINMAKNQLLALNPNKINGVCGRLFCCLSYENSNYNYYKSKFPEIGEIVKYNSKTCKVISLDLFHNKYKVISEENEIYEVIMSNGS